MSRQLSSQEARQLGRIGGLSTWAKDPERARAQARAACEAREARFASETARRLYYAKLSLAGVKARQRKAVAS